MEPISYIREFLNSFCMHLFFFKLLSFTMDFEWKQRIIFTFVVLTPCILGVISLPPERQIHPHEPGLYLSRNPEKVRLLAEYRAFEGRTNCPVQDSSVPTCDTITDSTKIPVSFDARMHWKKCSSLWEVRDQGACNSWASALASVLTDRLCIASTNPKAAEKFRVSEQDLLECAVPQGEEEEAEDLTPACYRPDLTTGSSFLSQVFSYLKEQGTVSGAAYNLQFGCKPSKIQPCNADRDNCPKVPNSALTCSRSCNNPRFTPTYEESLRRIERVCRLPQNDEAAIQREILRNGPVLAVMHLQEDLYSYNMTFNHGIYETLALDGDSTAFHPVRIVGWGSERSEGYWIVSNSWGYNWGDGGFFKVKRTLPDFPRPGAYLTCEVYLPSPDFSGSAKLSKRKCPFMNSSLYKTVSQFFHLS